MTDVAEQCEPDVVIECTGVAELVAGAMQHTAPGAIVCLTGVSRRRARCSLDVGALNNELVLENDVVFGSVNANRRHFEQAVKALTRRRPGLARAADHPHACRSSAGPRRSTKGDDDIKVVVEFASAEPRRGTADTLLKRCQPLS